MTIDSEVLNSESVDLLCRMYAAEYTPQSPVSMRDPVPSMLNALGACAGFSSQVAVWRSLVIPKKRNPGDFLVFASPKSGGTFFFGEAINQFLLSAHPDRLSFLSLAAATLLNASELPDIRELARHVSHSVGTEEFGRPRVPPHVDLLELPRAALTRTWGKAADILRDHPAAEWPALLGAAAHNIIRTNRDMLEPPAGLKILLEAAVPMSKLDPATVEQSGVPTPTFTDWSMRALHPENNQDIVTKVRGAMPTMPQNIRPFIIRQPTVAFVNLSGESCDAIVAEDRAEIGDLFHGRIRVTTAVPLCDVLFLYCDFEPSGEVSGEGSLLRDLIAKSGASVAVIASEVRPEILSEAGFKRTLARGGNSPVNLVVTISRKGPAFGSFFKSLFRLMLAGESLAMAWIELAPQGPQQPEDIPVTICQLEAGHVTFGKSPPQ